MLRSSSSLILLTNQDCHLIITYMEFIICLLSLPLPPDIIYWGAKCKHDLFLIIVPLYVNIHILITNLNSDCGVGDVITVPLGSGLEGLSGPSMTTGPELKGSLRIEQTHCATLTAPCPHYILHLHTFILHILRPGGGEVASEILYEVIRTVKALMHPS